MKLLSVNVGGPREVKWQGRSVRTSIFKAAVDGPVHVAKLNLDGDEQSDLAVHGGVDKAVYLYPSEHYPFWRERFPNLQLGWAALGENLTTEGILEQTTNIGDRFGIGTAEFVVTQPRMPCYKLGIRFGDASAIKMLLQSGRTGFYFSVSKEGTITAGDPIRLLEQDNRHVSVTDIVELYSGATRNTDLLALATELPSLPLSWRDYFRRHLTG
ncbi:MAG: MOSC domain-containing protein [Chthoniobacterales bacterium]